MPPLSVYVHIPFCSRKCPYCAFTSGFKPSESSIEKYAGALCAEIRLFKKMHAGIGPVETVYIGGGTPSLLPSDILKMLLAELNSEFVLLNHENTIEANPEDITIEKAYFWKNNGINRVSLGFQSMEDNVLNVLGRCNDAGSNIRAVAALRDAGLNNISLDLIACVRGEHPVKNIEAVLALKPPHISVYQLSIEENTRLHTDTRLGKYRPLSDAASLSHYRVIRKALTCAGYIHYEISNFALGEKYFSIHNMNYWNSGSYIGLGAGASGFFGGTRWTNTSSLKKYLSEITADRLPREFSEFIDKETAGRELIMLGLRKSAGIPEEEFDALLNGIPLNLKGFLKRKNGHVSLTERGFEVSNRVISELWKFIK
jgi:oxygen-independent coproporphyrinogen III oxidase